MEPFIGQICLFGFNFAPRGWAFCDGSLLSISQNSALFALLGTYYGGDGQTTFGLPDLRGRVVLAQGQGPGLGAYVIGEKAGSENVTLLGNQIPAHNHSLTGSGNAATANTLSGNVLALPNGSNPVSGDAVTVNAYASANNPVTADPSAIGMAGGGLPVPVMQPFLVLNYCIAVEGVFPSRQ